MSIRDPACGMPLDPRRTEFKTEFLAKQFYFDSEYCMRSFIEGPRVAYFSMEIGIESEVPTYSGGLGVLAGDVIRSSADLKIPLVAVTLISKKGYLKQKITFDGRQLEYPKEWTRARYRPNETISEEEKEKSQISTTSWNILLFLKSTRNGTVGYV